MSRLKFTPKSTRPKFSKELLSPASLLTWLGLFLLWLVSLLSYQTLMKLGNVLGVLIYKISPHRREISKINLNQCLQLENDRLEELVKLNFKATGRGVFEMATAWWASDKRIQEIKTKIINEDLLKDLDTGALVLLKHSTHLELDIRLLSQYFPLTGMFKEQTNKAINYTMIRARNNYVRAALTNKEAVKAIKWIKAGEFFLYAADQDYGMKVSKMIPFFERDAATVTFPAFLSSKDIKVIFADVSKIEDTYVIELQCLESSKDEEVFLKDMNLTYQKFIEKETEAYLWTHRRFKSNEGQSIYPNWSSREKRRAKRRAKQKGN